MKYVKILSNWVSIVIRNSNFPFMWKSAGESFLEHSFSIAENIFAKMGKMWMGALSPPKVIAPIYILRSSWFADINVQLSGVHLLLPWASLNLYRLKHIQLDNQITGTSLNNYLAFHLYVMTQFCIVL